MARGRSVGGGGACRAGVQRRGHDKAVPQLPYRRRQALRPAGAPASAAAVGAALKLTLDNMLHGIVCVDASGAIRLSNQRAVELLDLPPALLAEGAPAAGIVRFQQERGDFAEAQPGDPVRRTRSGSYLEVRTLDLPGGGQVQTYADVTRYVQAQQALVEADFELRAMLDGFPGLMVVSDEDLRYVYLNERGAAWIGRPRDELIGRSARDFLSERRAAEILAFIRNARTGEQDTAESEYPSPHGEGRRWLRVTQVMGSDARGRGRKCYAFAVDVTAQKEAEAALVAAKDEAERANRAKSDFLRNISHELRTPLNAVTGFAELLASDADAPLSPKHAGYVDEIRQGARHLLGLINELLDLSMAEQGRLTVRIEPVGLRELIDECASLMAPLAQKAQTRIVVDAELLPQTHGLADRTRLKQVLLNLISNAIKYGGSRGPIRILQQRSAAGIEISVNDEGPGLDAAQQARLFRAFERLDAGATATEGAGIGLALSRTLMNAMGGSIDVESTPGEGSTFRLVLPAAEPPRPATRAPLPDAGCTGGAVPPFKVLYIEDNTVNIMLMQAMLARLPTHRPVTMMAAELPEAGLRLAADECPDLILLDIQLPLMSGFDVLRLLRAGEACRHIPVIAVSANTLPGDVEAAQAAGFQDYLAKPFEMHDLHSAVLRQLSRPNAGE